MQIIRLIKLFATIVEKLSVRRPINLIISLDKYADIYGNYQASHFSLISRSIIHHYIKVCIGSCKTSHGLFMNFLIFCLLYCQNLTDFRIMSLRNDQAIKVIAERGQLCASCKSDICFLLPQRCECSRRFMMTLT